MHLKKMTRILSAFFAVLTVVMLFGVLPGKVSAAVVSAPVVSVSNVADSGKIKLTWKAVEGAEKYEVYRATSKSGKYTRQTATTKTSFTNVKDTAGKTYYYKVRAISAKGAYADSKIINRACDLSRPVVTVTNAASSGSPKLSWKAVEGAVSYQVYRSTSKNGTHTLVKTTTGTSFTNTSAKAGRTYYYKVVAAASNSAANSADSTIVYRTCDLAQPKVTVTNVASSGDPKVSWKAVDGAVSYQVYSSTSRNGAYTLTKTTTGTSYTHTSAKVGKTYYYKVRAVAEKAAANSAYSSVVYRVCDLARPEISVSLDTKGKPVVTWKAVSGAVTYKVYRATSKTGTYSRIYTTSATKCTNVKAEDGKTYYYKVRALCNNSSAASAYSSVVSIKAGNSDFVYVKDASVYVYKSPSSSSKSLRLFYMSEVKLGNVVSSGSSGKWQEIYYEGELYYIWLPTGSDKFTTHKSCKEDYTVKNQYQQEILDLAMTIDEEWDTRYVSSASGVFYSDGSVGFDCSGFAGYVINTVMQKYNPAYRVSPATRTMFTLDYVYNKGMKGEFRVIDVELEDAQVGDIVFFKSATTGKLNHCGLYLGNNEFLHSTSAWDKGVGLMTLEGKYSELLIGIRRFVPDEVVPANATYYATQGNRIYSDRNGENDTGLRVSRGEAVKVLYATYKENGDPRIAHIRTNDGTYGFVWFKYYSKTK